MTLRPSSYSISFPDNWFAIQLEELLSADSSILANSVAEYVNEMVAASEAVAPVRMANGEVLKPIDQSEFAGALEKFLDGVAPAYAAEGVILLMLRAPAVDQGDYELGFCMGLMSLRDLPEDGETPDDENVPGKDVYVTSEELDLPAGRATKYVRAVEELEQAPPVAVPNPPLVMIAQIQYELKLDDCVIDLFAVTSDLDVLTEVDEELEAVAMSLELEFGRESADGR